MLLRETNSDGWDGASWCEPLEARLFLAAVGSTEVRGDFTGDGRVDIVTTRGGLKLRVGTAKGFKAGVPINGVGFARGGSVAAADFNGDGALDLAVFGGNSAPGTLKGSNGRKFTNGGLFELLNKGNGTFHSATPIGSHVTAAQVPNGVVVTGDFNLDGKADVVVTASGSTTPTEFNNLGASTGTSPTTTGANGVTTGVLGTNAAAGPTGTLGTGTTNVLGGTNGPVGTGTTGTFGSVTGITTPTQPGGGGVGPPAAPSITIVIDGNGNGTFQPARRVK